MPTACGAHPVLRIPLPHVVDVPPVRAALNVKLVCSVRSLSNFPSANYPSKNGLKALGGFHI